MSEKVFEPLFARDASDNIRQWQISVAPHFLGGVAIKITHGLLGGVMQTDTRFVHEGKNLGRSNATTALEQACKEAAAAWQLKRDKGYSLDPLAPITDRPVLPMLAHKFVERGDDFDWSHAFVQPKLDGTRCLAPVAYSAASLISRNGKPILTMPHIADAVASLNLPSGTVLDGELFTPHLHFQDIVAAVKKRNANTPLVKYHVYDVGDEDSPFHRRNGLLRDLQVKLPEEIVYVQTERVQSLEEVMVWHKRFTAMGYEGTMLRDGHAEYVFNYRSPSLLKLKDFIDDEFVIVRTGEGSGREEGCIMFTCQTPAGIEFDVRPMGSLEVRRAMLQAKHDYAGEKLTVRYQNLTKAGVPRFPVGVCVRDYE